MLGFTYVIREQDGFLRIWPPLSVRWNGGSQRVWLCEQLGATGWVSQWEEGGLCFQLSGSRRCERTLSTRWNFSRRSACGATTPRLPQSSLCTKPVVRASLSCGFGRNPGARARRLGTGSRLQACPHPPSAHRRSPRGTFSQQGPGGTVRKLWTAGRGWQRGGSLGPSAGWGWGG